MPYYAHTLEGKPPEDWEPLEAHLQEVATLASEFAGKFSAGDWGRLAGLWHDVGKYSPAFQNYLMTENGFAAHLEEQTGRVDHSTAGAQHANEYVKPWGRLLAYILAGHHAGLADSSVQRTSLDARLTRKIEPYDSAPESLLNTSTVLSNPNLTVDAKDHARLAFQLAFFTRILFSCLVDADFLATEAFMNPEQHAIRPKSTTTFPDLKSSLDNHLESLSQRSESISSSTVAECRTEVLAACRNAAEISPGFFSLTVPTGGGKTLASLAFALEHIVAHGLRRVIYAIPFTSIIEQTATVFRDVFQHLPEEVVLEHHSNVDPGSEHETPRSRLAAENWDAPLVVTTNVQLFESLFSARTSRCRKLHNLVGSVIILDEAQTLPVEFLRPVTTALRELVTDYHCTVVLCTATQPAITLRDEFPIGLENVREIVPEPPKLYERMKRVKVEFIGQVTDDELVARMTESPNFLAVVNTRRHAARLFEMLHSQSDDHESLFHLSTLMCGEHRAQQLKRIRQRLGQGLPCRVISTQLVEAGVDIDFPVVYRAMTGLDSVAQAAGRCNREGKLSSGIVYLFDPVDCRLQGYLASVATTAREIIPDFADLLDPAAISRYFQLHYWKQSGDHQWDERQVMACFPTPPERFAFDFRAAAERFRMIDDQTKAVFVPFGKGQALIEQLRKDGPYRTLLRKLQRFTVGIYPQVYAQVVGSDIEELAAGGYAVLINKDLYDDQLGLRFDRHGFHEPESLVF